jgi:hypothetical protein
VSKITIGKNEFDAEEKSINQSELLFYEENPRIYSLLKADEDATSQKDIENILKKMDHVKQLRVSIEQNGGVIDPLIVMRRRDDYVVLEGNSRLAAYRILADKNPYQWREVKCLILSDEISEDDIFTLLGQYHLIGRKDWSIFEQAAYLFRKKHASGLDNDILAKSIGMSASKVKQYLDVYTFMRDNDDLRPDRWSYYDEYLKNRGIKKYRDTNPNIDCVFVNQVKTGGIRQAIDVRDVLGAVAKGTDKTSKRLMGEVIAESATIYDAYDRFEATGKTSNAYIKIKKFRETISDSDFQKKIKAEAVSTRDLAFELKKVKQILERLLNEITD